MYPLSHIPSIAGEASRGRRHFWGFLGPGGCLICSALGRPDRFAAVDAVIIPDRAGRRCDEDPPEVERGVADSFAPAHTGDGRYCIFTAPHFSAQYHDDVCNLNWTEVPADASGMVSMPNAMISNYWHTNFYS